MRLSVPERLVRTVLAAGLALAVLLPAAAPAAAIINDKTLRLGTTQAIDSVNPYQSALVESYEAFELSWDQLVGFGQNLEPVPAFATSWERATDGKSWTFKFRPDLKWSDGQPATSEDACFSWQLDLDAIADETNVGLGYLDPGIKDAGVTKVECPDATTMIVSTEDDSNRVLQTYVPILPKHIYGKLDYKKIGDETFEPPADGSGLVGTGAYQLVEYKVNELARFKRNPNYWGKQGFADEIVMQFFSSNDTMFQALKAGEIDYARKISPEQFKQLQGDPDITAVTAPRTAGPSSASTRTGRAPARRSRTAARRRRRFSTRCSVTRSAIHRAPRRRARAARPDGPLRVAAARALRGRRGHDRAGARPLVYANAAFERLSGYSPRSSPRWSPCSTSSSRASATRPSTAPAPAPEGEATPTTS